MINIFNSVAANCPKSGGSSTAIVQGILACLLFIALAILEYSLILAHKKYSSLKVDGGKRTCEGTISQKSQTQEIAKRLDKLMLILFPPSFFMFSVVFWSLW